MSKKQVMIGVDLGGTKIATGLADRQGNILAETRVPTGAEDGPQAVIERILGTIESVMEKAGKTPDQVGAIGFCAPGALDIARGMVLVSPNLKWENIPLRQIVEDRFGIPTTLDNDANVAGFGEAVYGAGKGSKDMIFMTISTGVGGGLILGGEIYHGAHDGAGEIGHITIEMDGPTCGCGNQGCIEALASGPALARTARERILAGESSKIVDLVDGNLEKITAVHLAEAARAGDGLAISVINKGARYIGAVLAGLVNTFNPEMIVIGGGVSQMGELILNPIRQELMKRAIPPFLKDLQVLPAKLGSDAGLRGALALAETQMEK